MKKLAIVLVAAMAAFVASAEEKKADSATAKADPAAQAKQVEARANRMIKSALALMAENEKDRGVGMLEAVLRMYPTSQARFRANLELGRHFTDKREFDRALQELKKAGAAAEDDVRAEALYLTGAMYVAKAVPGEAVMALRRLTQEYPTSRFANDAFFMIGQIHFEAGRWARAADAYNMVGTAVPENKKDDTVYAEAGQRVYVHVRDKDLAIQQALGKTNSVVFISKSGDEETAVLHSFGRGDGDFVASVKTVAEDSAKGDGVLTVRGNEPIRVRYVDANTTDGVRDRTLESAGQVVSSAVVSFMDGAQRQRVKGVFVGQPAFLKLKDLDLDTTANADSAKVVIKTQYRERPEPAPGETVAPPPPPDAPWLTRGEITCTLVETAPHSGIFTGRLVPRLQDSTNAPALPAGEVWVKPDDKLVLEYEDKKHLGGDKPVFRTAEAMVLIGGSTEPQSIVAHSSEVNIQAKKLVLEAQLLQKWGSIFRDVGLQEAASTKADEGMKRIQDVFEMSRQNTLERGIIESAYETKWNLYFVLGDMRSAIATCNELVRRYPDTLLADRAFMQIAAARIAEDKAESSDSALKVLGAIIQLPTSAYKAEAQYRIGEVLEREAKRRVQGSSRAPDYAGAIQAYRVCAETYPTSSFAGESYKKIVDYAIAIKNYTQAMETLERVFQDYSDAPWIDDMMLKAGVVMFRMGNKDGAKEKFKAILEEYPGGKAATSASAFLKRISAAEESAE